MFFFFFFFLAPKHRSWVLDRNKAALSEAVLMCTHNLRFEQKQEKYHNFSPENHHFYTLKNWCISHRHVCIM